MLSLAPDLGWVKESTRGPSDIQGIWFQSRVAGGWCPFGTGISLLC